MKPDECLQQKPEVILHELFIFWTVSTILSFFASANFNSDLFWNLFDVDQLSNFFDLRSAAHSEKEQGSHLNQWCVLCLFGMCCSGFSLCLHLYSGAPPPHGSVQTGGSTRSGQRAHPSHRRPAAAADTEELPPVPMTTHAQRGVASWLQVTTCWCGLYRCLQGRSGREGKAGSFTSFAHFHSGCFNLSVLMSFMILISFAEMFVVSELCEY